MCPQALHIACMWVDYRFGMAATRELVQLVRELNNLRKWRSSAYWVSILLYFYVVKTSIKCIERSGDLWQLGRPNGLTSIQNYIKKRLTNCLTGCLIDRPDTRTYILPTSWRCDWTLTCWKVLGVVTEPSEHGQQTFQSDFEQFQFRFAQHTNTRAHTDNLHKREKERSEQGKHLWLTHAARVTHTHMLSPLEAVSVSARLTLANADKIVGKKEKPKSGEVEKPVENMKHAKWSLNRGKQTKNRRQTAKGWVRNTPSPHPPTFPAILFALSLGFLGSCTLGQQQVYEVNHQPVEPLERAPKSSLDVTFSCWLRPASVFA